MGEPAGFADVCAEAGAVVQGADESQREVEDDLGLGLSPGDQVWEVEVWGGTTAFTCERKHLPMRLLPTCKGQL